MSDTDIFWINSLGETPKTKGGASLEEVRKHFDLKSNEKVKKKHWDQYFNLVERRALNDEEYKLMQHWKRLSAVTNDLFRVQARIRNDSRGDRHVEISLTTEVKERDKFQKYWSKVHDFVLATNAKIEWEHTDKELDHFWKTDEKGKKIPGSDVYGKDHGKLFRQVGIVWTFRPSTKRREMEAFIKEMTKEMRRRKLSKNWVSVI